MSTNNFPDIDPASTDTLIGLMRYAFSKMMQDDLDGALPAQVVSFNRNARPPRAQVQIMVPIVTTGGDIIKQKPIASVPVFERGGGGFLLSFNLNPGDFGWIKACDRDISLFLQQMSAARPNTKRKFNFSDGVFYPHAMFGYTLNSEDMGHAVWQKLDSSVRIALWDDKVKITAPNGLLVDGPIHATGNIITDQNLTVTQGMTVAGEGGGTCEINTSTCTLNAAVRINGDETVVGNIGATGDITAHIPPP